MSGVRRTDSNTEPGNPEPTDGRITEHEARRIATQDDVAGLNEMLVECGCGECSEIFDPLAVTNIDEEDDDTGLNSSIAERATAKEYCSNPVPVTLDVGGEVFGRLTYDEYGDPSVKRRLNKGRQNYARLMDRDRHVRREFGRASITTVLLTIRPSPVNDDGEWRNPMVLLRETANATQKLNETAMRYAKKDGHRVHTSYVVSGTAYWGTPHGHVLLYLEDPEDRARMSDFAPAIKVALSRLTSYSDDAHVFDDEGEDGPVVVNHNPNLKDIEENGLDLSAVYDALRRSRDNGDEADRPPADAVPDPTMAAGLYIGTQLAYIRTLGAIKYDWERRPTNAAFEFGATAWGLRGHDDNAKRLSGGTQF